MKHITFFIALLLVSISVLNAQDTIVVSSGWNMVGDISRWHLNEIRSEPAGIIASSFYGYSTIGYTATDTVNKGKGYWVKTTQAGILIWDSSSGFTCGETIEYSNHTYNTVQIGEQCWFKENLDIGTMVDSLQNQTDNSTIEKYCYNNNPSNCSTYGGLYQWNEVMQYSTTSGARGICPIDWHIPTYTEYQTLLTTVSNDGNALKAVGQGTGGGGGTNTSGFSALLSGYRNYNGYFNYLAFYTYFWISMEEDATSAYYLILYSKDSNFNMNYYATKAYGFNVRCLKD